MEEILGSIRDILAEGDANAAQPADASQPSEPGQIENGSTVEVLELTQEFVARSSVSPRGEAGSARANPATANDIFSDHTWQAGDPFDTIPDEHEPATARLGRATMAADGSSVESVFERAVRESFEPVLQKYLQDNSQRVIQGMNPLISDWMDENFPALLDDVVRGEVERIVKAKKRR
jgi:hypothetical protein